MIYIPSDDSFLIKTAVRKLSKGKKVLDMGAGSGILGLAALKADAKSVLFTDIDKKAVNYLKNKGYNAIQSDLFSNLKRKFGLIIFNSPYLPFDSREDLESSKVTSGGKRGDEIILKFLKDVKKHLANNGLVLIVLSSLTPKKRILKILKEKKLDKKVLSKKKFFMEELEVWKIRKI